MTKKLYYQDAYIETFTTSLINQEKDESGQTYIVLEETAFYPTGGGQPFDTGTLNNIPVINVEEINGEIRHYIESPLEDTNNIYGQINWNRRFDHMQQHAGQHILSAAFEELFQYETVSFHLGKEEVTIDLAVESLSEEEVRAVEEYANKIILDNRPIETKWVNPSDLIQYPLRKQPTVTENIRLVIIPNFDYNGCGGTHPSSTGQVGAIKVLDWERQRKQIRIQFVCGNRVLNKLNEKQKVILELTKLLNSPEESMVHSVARLLDSAKNNEKNLEDLRNTLLHYEVKALLNEKLLVNNIEFVAKVFQNRPLKDLQKLARMLVNENENGIILFIAENESQLQVVIARGQNIVVSMKNALVEIVSHINGKGGGNDAFAQGGGDFIMKGEDLLYKGLEILQK